MSKKLSVEDFTKDISAVFRKHEVKGMSVKVNAYYTNSNLFSIEVNGTYKVTPPASIAPSHSLNEEPPKT